MKLEQLYLINTRVSDVSPLSKMTNLEYLNLTSTRVSDVSPLSKLVKLEHLYLMNTGVSDVSPLSKMNLSWCGSESLCSWDSSVARNLRPSVNLTVNADGSVSLPAPRWTDGSFVAPSSTSPAGGVLDAKRGVVTWKGYDAKASYSYDFDRGGVFSGHVTGVKPAPTPKVYVVLFDSQGGSGVASQRVTAGRRASRPADPARSGFVFAGWYTARSGGSEYDFGKPVTGSLTLYARWARKAQPAASTVAMFRLYNPNSGEHFYTGNVAERDHLAAVGWKYEGVGWAAPAKSGTPVYRMYNPNAGDHHYTMNKAEHDMLVRLGWRSEGVGWYSAENPGRAPLYREYNPNARAGAHNYTLNRAEDDMLVRVGWRAEGIAWYAVHA